MFAVTLKSSSGDQRDCAVAIKRLADTNTNMTYSTRKTLIVASDACCGLAEESFSSPRAAPSLASHPAAARASATPGAEDDGTLHQTEPEEHRPA